MGAMKSYTRARIVAINKIWCEGMTASQIAATVNREPWGGKKPTRNGIIGIFTRWPKELHPCRLPPRIEKKSASLPPRGVATINPESEVEHTVKKRLPRKSSKNLNTGYVAAEKPKAAPPPVRTDYGLTDKAIRRYEHEQRMLARDKANISSPAYRFDGGRQRTNTGIGGFHKRLKDTD